MGPKIQKLIIHKVGNKLSNDKYTLSNSLINISLEHENLFNKYFLPTLKKEEYYNFYHETDISFNEIYSYVSKMFDDKNSFIEESRNIAKHLYEKSEHPKIKEGDIYIVYFNDIQIDEQYFDAIGIFKSESKDTFIKVRNISNNFDVSFDSGSNINKIDKGCLIYNTEKENGFLISIIDNLSKSGSEARFWKDDFLYVKPRKDEYFKTQNVLSLCKNFVTIELPNRFEISKADQADLLNKSVKFFKENDFFNLNVFTKEVILKPEVIELFKNYSTEFQEVREIKIEDNFTISNSAVKKQVKVFKSVIKLDANFDIYVHGNRELIEQGVDDSGRKYYKIYYKEEN